MTTATAPDLAPEEVPAAKPASRVPWTLRPPLSRSTQVSVVVLVVVAAITLVPLVILVLDTFTRGELGEKVAFNVDSWGKTLGESAVLRAIWTTILLVLATEVIATPVGVAITWVMARTNVRFRRAFDAMMWCAFFLPVLAVINGWVLLLDPQYGLFNTFLKNTLGIHLGFDIYSFWGIVWIHLVTRSISAKYILLLPTFQAMDSALEDASRMCGAGLVSTLRRVSVPLLTPSIVMVVVLSAVYAVESFEPELVLGLPANIHVYSTKVYELAYQNPPLFTDAKVLGLTMLVLMLPMIITYQAISRRRAVAMLSGRAKNERRRLGRGNRALLSTALLVFGLLCTVVPLVLLVLGTFMTLFGYFDIAHPWTTKHWSDAFSSDEIWTALRSTLRISIGGAIGGTILYTLIAFVIVRTKGVISRVTELLSWLPVALPGLVFGLGLLASVLRVPGLKQLYGTSWTMIVAVIVASMTTGLQLLTVNLAQQSRELEEASVICGASRWNTLRRITLPLMAPALATVAILTFAAAAANVTHVVLLSVPGSQPLPVLQLGYMTTGSYETASVIGTIIVALSLGFAFVSRAVARRWERD